MDLAVSRKFWDSLSLFGSDFRRFRSPLEFRCHVHCFFLLCAYKTMIQALIEIPFSIGIPMSCASFFLVMCIQDYDTSVNWDSVLHRNSDVMCIVFSCYVHIQDYPTTVNCDLAEESKTVSGWECDSFHLCVPIFGELTSPQLVSSKY
jgi:hypothetical protein